MSVALSSHSDHTPQVYLVGLALGMPWRVGLLLCSVFTSWQKADLLRQPQKQLGADLNCWVYQ